MGIFPEFISKIIGGKKDATPVPGANNGPSLGVTESTVTTGTESGQAAYTDLNVSPNVRPTVTTAETASTVTSVDSNTESSVPSVSSAEPTLGTTSSSAPQAEQTVSTITTVDSAASAPIAEAVPTGQPTPVATGTPDQQ